MAEVSPSKLDDVRGLKACVVSRSKPSSPGVEFRGDQDAVLEICRWQVLTDPTWGRRTNSQAPASPMPQAAAATNVSQPACVTVIWVAWQSVSCMCLGRLKDFNVVP